MSKFEFQNVGSILYKFIWEDFCDKYIEMAKYSLGDQTTKQVLLMILKGILKMLHPFMPFVTDEIYSHLPDTKENIMISDYPVREKKYFFLENEAKITTLLEFVTAFRTVKLEHQIGADFNVVFQNKEDYSFISKLLKLESHIIEQSEKSTYYPVTVKNYSLYLYGEKVKTKEEEEKKQREIETLEKSIAKRKALLSNESFCKKAPGNLVNEEKQKLELEQRKLKELESLSS